jgi:hypothetical protein
MDVLSTNIALSTASIAFLALGFPLQVCVSRSRNATTSRNIEGRPRKDRPRRDDTRPEQLQTCGRVDGKQTWTSRRPFQVSAERSSLRPALMWVTCHSNYVDGDSTRLFPSFLHRRHYRPSLVCSLFMSDPLLVDVSLLYEASC